jgi:hypothetical protein
VDSSQLEFSGINILAALSPERAISGQVGREGLIVRLNFQRTWRTL